MRWEGKQEKRVLEAQSISRKRLNESGDRMKRLMTQGREIMARVIPLSSWECKEEGWSQQEHLPFTHNTRAAGRICGPRCFITPLSSALLKSEFLLILSPPDSFPGLRPIKCTTRVIRSRSSQLCIILEKRLTWAELWCRSLVKFFLSVKNGYKPTFFWNTSLTSTAQPTLHPLPLLPPTLRLALRSILVET